MAISPYTAREQARWMKPNASLWVRPDAARFLTPGTRVEDVYPALALKYNPNQPRVPSGNPDGGRWTDGEGGAGQLAQPMGNIGITDRRVVSDADPEGMKPGAQYAQSRGGGRPPTFVQINGQNVPLTPGQAARLEVVRARAEDAAARIREVDPNWKPQPSAVQTPDGLIRAYEADAAQAQARISEFGSAWAWSRTICW